MGGKCFFGENTFLWETRMLRSEENTGWDTAATARTSTKTKKTFPNMQFSISRAGAGAFVLRVLLPCWR